MDSQNITITTQHSFLQKRRFIVEQDQRNRRQQIFNQTRKIFADSETIQPQKINPQETLQKLQHSDFKNSSVKQSIQEQGGQQIVPQKKARHSRQKRQFEYYRNFQHPQWLIHLPSSLKQYYFCLRPIGQRVFIYIKKNKLLIISLYGNILQSVEVQKPHFNKTLLQGYFLKEQRKLIVSDLLVWKQNPMSCSQFEFRIMWLVNNLNQTVVHSLLNNKLNLKIMPYWNVTTSNLKEVYSSVNNITYPTDGLLFYHKDSYYIHQVNPHVMLWKDTHVAPSIYGKPNQRQQALSIQQQISSISEEQLKCQKQLNQLNLSERFLHFYAELNIQQRIIYSYDGVPLSVVNLNEQLLSGYHAQCIVKFTFENLSENDSSFQSKMNNVVFPYKFENLKIISTHQLNTRIPDSLTKIIWKYSYANGTTISFQNLLKEINEQQTQQKMELE